MKTPFYWHLCSISLSLFSLSFSDRKKKNYDSGTANEILNADGSNISVDHKNAILGLKSSPNFSIWDFFLPISDLFLSERIPDFLILLFISIFMRDATELNTDQILILFISLINLSFLSLSLSPSTVINKGQTETTPYRFLGRNGGYCWVVSQATLVYDKQKPQSVVCVNYVIR